MYGNGDSYVHIHHNGNVHHSMKEFLFLQDGTPSAAFAVVAAIGLLSVLGLWDFFAARKRRAKK